MPPRRIAELPELPRPLTPQRLGRIRSALLAWYDREGTPFPWRTARDPYLALVAAVASQQTQMSRVLQIYERWTEAFPTLAALASAERAEVLRVWGRAGYPRRAVGLHETARICLERHGGALPREEAALLALPGVGPFTAAIVRCFGFGEDAVAIDTNIVRIVGRVVLGDLQPAKDSRPADLEAAAARLMRPGTAAAWNPALMEYGARVCVPRPRCDVCVVASLCAARPRFASGERAEPVRAQGAFEGSDREWRGRIMSELREEGSLARSTLTRRLRSAGAEASTVRRLVDDLVREGLAWRAAGRVGLGERGPMTPSHDRSSRASDQSDS
jgi:A/G-specific adenine glycosylase